MDIAAYGQAEKSLICGYDSQHLNQKKRPKKHTFTHSYICIVV